MEIKRTSKATQISKAETDNREEVSKIQPGGKQQIPDSFEQGKSRSSAKDPNSATTGEPKKKAGQRTGGILIKQMTAARLGGEAGIKKDKEAGGRKDLDGREREQAVATDPKLTLEKDNVPKGPTGRPLPDGAFTGDARSNLEKRKGDVEKFVAEHGFDLAKTGDGTAAGGTGIGPSGFQNPGRMNADDLNQAMTGGPAGPRDPFDSVNEKFQQLSSLNNINSAGNIFSELRNAANDSDTSHMNYGKGMVASGEPYVRTNTDGSQTYVWDNTTEKDGNYSQSHYEFSPKPYGEIHTYDSVERTKSGEYVQTHSEEVKHKDYTDFYKKETKTDANGNTTTTVTSGTKNSDGSGKSKSNSTTVDSSGNVISTTTSSSTTDKNGVTTTTTTTKPSTPDPEKYHDPHVEAMQQEMNNMLRKLGLGNMILHRTTHVSGKGPDPTPDGNPTRAEDAEPSLISQFGKYGLVGQPNQQNEGGEGGAISSDNPVITGGNIDYGPDSNQTGYRGEKRTESESDAIANDPTGQSIEEQDEDNKKTTQSKGAKKRPTS